MDVVIGFVVVVTVVSGFLWFSSTFFPDSEFDHFIMSFSSGYRKDQREIDHLRELLPVPTDYIRVNNYKSFYPGIVSKVTKQREQKKQLFLTRSWDSIDELDLELNKLTREIERRKNGGDPLPLALTRFLNNDMAEASKILLNATPEYIFFNGEDLHQFYDFLEQQRKKKEQQKPKDRMNKILSIDEELMILVKQDIKEQLLHTILETKYGYKDPQKRQEMIKQAKFNVQRSREKNL